MGSFTSWDGSTVVECGYDYQGRRYMKKVTQNGMVASHERYLYRGHLQITALDMLNSRNVLRTLLWDPVEPVATRPLALVQDNALYCYGREPGKCCKSATEKEKTACLNEHPEYASSSSYNLITGNCRDKAKKVLKECCMEIDKETKRPAGKGQILKIKRIA